MGISVSKENKICASEGTDYATNPQTDESELDAALSAFKLKMGTKAVDNAVRKMLPSFYIRGATVGPKDIVVAKGTWHLVSSDDNPEFKRRKDTPNFKYTASLRKLIKSKVVSLRQSRSSIHMDNVKFFNRVVFRDVLWRVGTHRSLYEVNIQRRIGNV
jgi:hypothetical protein